MPRNPKRSPVGRRTGVLSYLGIGVLIIAACGTAVYALGKDHDAGLAAVAAGYTPPTLPGDTASATPTPGPTTTGGAAPSGTPAPSATPVAASVAPRVVFVGDGYAAADGASNAAHGFPALIGEAKRWNVEVISCELAGYVAKGTCGENYAGLIPKVVAAKPDIVVVTGGRNDVPNASSAPAAASAFYAQLTSALPGATVYAVSPVWDDGHALAPLGVVQQAVKAAAAASGVRYLDIGEPLRDHPELVAADGILPNDAGNAALAAAIEAALG